MVEGLLKRQRADVPWIPGADETVGQVIVGAVGDLVGNWSWTVWLLIPLALLLAFVTSLVLGTAGEPTDNDRREGGVTRYLARHERAGNSTEEVP